jgi:isopenicillin-N epimerase
VRARCHTLARHAHDTLTQRYGFAAVALGDDWAQMVVIPVPAQDADAMRRHLYDQCRIEVPVTTHDGQAFVPVSVQGYNTLDDIDALLAAPALS